MFQQQKRNSFILEQLSQGWEPCYDFCPVQAIAIKVVSIKGIETAIFTFLETVQFWAAAGSVYEG